MDKKDIELLNNAINKSEVLSHMNQSLTHTK